MIADLTIWDVNVESGLLLGRLLHKAKLKGNTIGFRDIFIASIALANGCQRVQVELQVGLKRTSETLFAFVH